MFISLGGENKATEMVCRRNKTLAAEFAVFFTSPAAWVVGLTHLNVCKMLNSGFQGAAPCIKGSSHDVKLVSLKNIGLTWWSGWPFVFSSTGFRSQKSVFGGDCRDYFFPCLTFVFCLATCLKKKRKPYKPWNHNIWDETQWKPASATSGVHKVALRLNRSSKLISADSSSAR